MGLAWGNVAWRGCWPQVKGALTTLSGGGLSGSALLMAGAAAFADDLHCEVLEVGEEGAEPFRVVEQGLVVGELAGDSRRVTVLPAILRVHYSA